MLLVTLLRIDQQHVGALWGPTDHVYTSFTEHTVLGRMSLDGLRYEQELIVKHNAQQSRKEGIMAKNKQALEASTSRRSFLQKGVMIGGAGTIGAGLLSAGLLKTNFAHAHGATSSAITKGDVAILRFLSAAEILETDLWQQYNELGGIQDSEVPGGKGSAATANGAAPVNLDKFRTLPSSKATGAQQIGRLTNLMQLTVDTSWWTRYRSRTKNPDFGDTFAQAIPGLSKGKFPAIPRNDGDLTPNDHIQAIANTAAFHFGFIEQGGTSLYPSLAQRVTNVEVLRILLSIGPTETAHFQTWHDKAGNAKVLTDPTNGLVFPDLNAPPFGGENFQTNLIMPEPTVFLSRTFPVVSIIRPTQTQGAAMGAVQALTADGLFIGQSPEFFAVLHDLAQQADAAQRGF